MSTLGQVLGSDLVENFSSWDFSEIEKVLATLSEGDAHNLVHAERLQREALRGADILSEYLSKMVKTVSYLESKLNSVKNKAALDAQPKEGQIKLTADQRKLAGECAPEVEEIAAQLAHSRGAKVLLEKKFDLIIRSHYFYKEVAGGLRRTVLGHTNGANNEW